MKTTLHVALDGSDNNPGTEDAPLATVAGARDAIRRMKRDTGPIEVLVDEGTYYLGEPFVLRPEDSGSESAPVTYAAKPGARVTLSGGRRVACRWQPYRDGIMMCRLPEVSAGDLDFTQLFVNGRRQTLARYPNADTSAPEQYSGYIHAAGRIADDTPDPCPCPDADMTFSGGAPPGITFDPETFTTRRWCKPDEAVIHIYQAHYWGNLQWRLRHIEWENHRIWFGEGGHQMGAKWYSDPSIVNEHSRFFVENVFEELDAPGEWYLDRDKGILYLMPEEGVDLSAALVEVPVFKRLIELRGSQRDPVRHISFSGFRLAHTASTFLDDYEAPSLSDWSIHRGGAVFFEGARDCSFSDSRFDAVGGNAVIEYNHIHNTCRETGDHGPFNSWGRDRGWCLAQSHGRPTAQRSHDAYEMLVDAMEPVIIRHNFFEEKAGWGLDLDDGASNYEIYNNLCVGVSMKLREGSHRTIYNNIWVNGANSPCFHIGNEDNHDRYFNNITVMSTRYAKPENDLNFAMGASYGEIYTLIRPPIHGPWLAEIDHNCFFSDVGEFVARVVPREAVRMKYNLEEWRELGFDRHSVFADPMFVDPENNDYRVRPESPALAVGFKNFEMGIWGLSDPTPHGFWSG